MISEKSGLGYEKTRLHPLIVVDSIVTVHYFEYSSNYYFSGEAHDFWEFLYVDKGEVFVMADTKKRLLRTRDIIFHQPMEFHNVSANGIVAPNLSVVAFECTSPAMDFFKDKVLQVTEKQHNYIADIIDTAYQLFDSPLDDPELKHLTVKNDETVFAGYEQLLKSSLELLLLDMLQSDKGESRIAATVYQKESDIDLYARTLRYFEEHVRDQLTVEVISDAMLAGRSHLQKLFHEKTGSGIIENFSRMKIQYARQIIREGRLNFTELAEYLGYSSLYYFSRQFKKLTGMTPSEYSKSILSKNKS